MKYLLTIGLAACLLGCATAPHSGSPKMEVATSGETRQSIENKLPRGFRHEVLSSGASVCGCLFQLVQLERYTFPNGQSIEVVYLPISVNLAQTVSLKKPLPTAPADPAIEFRLPLELYGKLPFGNDETIIAGRLFDQPTGRPLRGCVIKITDVREVLPADRKFYLVIGRTKTDKQGHFRFVVPGKYRDGELQAAPENLARSSVIKYTLTAQKVRGKDQP